MDVGIVRAVGVGPVPLRTVVRVWRQLVLVARAGGRVSGLLPSVGAGLRFLFRLWTARGNRIRSRFWIWSGVQLRARWLAGDRTRRFLPSVVRALRPELWCDRDRRARGWRYWSSVSARSGASVLQHRIGGHQRTRSRRHVFDGLE